MVTTTQLNIWPVTAPTCFQVGSSFLMWRDSVCAYCSAFPVVQGKGTYFILTAKTVDCADLQPTYVQVHNSLDP